MQLSYKDRPLQGESTRCDSGCNIWGGREESTWGEWECPVPGHLTGSGRRLMVLGSRDLWRARGRLPRCHASALRPYTGVGGYLSAGARTLSRGLRCVGVRGEGCGRPSSSKGNDGRDKRRSTAREGLFNCPRPTLSPCLRGDAKCKRGGGLPPVPKGQESPPALCIAVLASGRATFRGTCCPALLRPPRAVRVAPVSPRVAEAKRIKIGMLLTLPLPGRQEQVRALSPYRRSRMPAPPAWKLPSQSAA